MYGTGATAAQQMVGSASGGAGFLGGAYPHGAPNFPPGLSTYGQQPTQQSGPPQQQDDFSLFSQSQLHPGVIQRPTSSQVLPMSTTEEAAANEREIQKQIDETPLFEKPTTGQGSRSSKLNVDEFGLRELGKPKTDYPSSSARYNIYNIKNFFVISHVVNKYHFTWKFVFRL